VRLAVGASRAAIIRLFLKEGARVLAAGFAVGLFGVFWAAKILESLVFGVQPSDLATRIASCVIMAVACLFAVRWRALGANRG
jgi:ABC-type antimicrobial peptide transport system permease subunit